MNLLRSVFAILIGLAALAFIAWFAHGCGARNASVDGLARAAFHEAQAQRYLGQRDAALEAVAERDSLLRVEQFRADSLAAESVRKDERITVLAGDLASAETTAEALADRFAETGDVGDCAAALSGCTEARQRAADVIDGQRESIETKDELLLVKDRQIEHYSVRGDSAIAALGYADLAYAEQEQRAEVFQRAAEDYKLQRNAVAIGAGVIIVGILVLK